MKMTVKFSGRSADRSEFRYAGRNLHAGDEFDTVSEKDAKALQTVGYAVPSTAERRGVSAPPPKKSKAADAPKEPAPEPVSEDPKPEADPAQSPETAPGEAAPVTAADRRYRRRDLRPEG
jgi:Ca2+-dependent lipid-binding protein